MMLEIVRDGVAVAFIGAAFLFGYRQGGREADAGWEKQFRDGAPYRAGYRAGLFKFASDTAKAMADGHARGYRQGYIDGYGAAEANGKVGAHEDGASLAPLDYKTVAYEDLATPEKLGAKVYPAIDLKA